jgi:DNA-binding GntR family transcriptional regulator
MTKPRSLADQVYEQLRADIVSGCIPSSEKLVELDIAERMGTSQGTIREALHRLECDGSVDRQAHRATYVTDIAETHRPILTAMRSGDPDAAGRAIEEHVMLIWQQIDHHVGGGD